MSEPKARITITLDADLLRRIKVVEEERGDSVSAIINRMIRNDIAHEEQQMRDMENPVMRTVLTALTKTPGVMESIASLVGNQLTKDQAEELRQNIQQQAKRGKQRVAKKGGKR